MSINVCLMTAVFLAITDYEFFSRAFFMVKFFNILASMKMIIIFKN